MHERLKTHIIIVAGVWRNYSRKNTSATVQKMPPNPALEVCQRFWTHARKMVVCGGRGDAVQKLEMKVRGWKHITTRWIGGEGKPKPSQGM